MDETYRHMQILPEAGSGEAGVPTRMEPTFSLAFFRKCKDGAVILNVEGRIGFINEPACAALGVASLGEVVQRTFADLWPDDVSENIRAAIERVLAGDAVRLANLPSQSGPLDMLGSPVMNKDGEVESVFAVLFPSGESPRISG